MRSERVIQVVREALSEALPDRKQAAGLLVAVSGGSDSVGMLVATVHARRMLGLSGPFEVMTVDHGLRPSSADEARFVEELAGSLGVSHHVGKLRLRRRAGESLEQAARRARYDRLVRRARQIGADAILTGHTADDQAETVLLNLLRGAVVTGLGAIPPVRVLRARPPLLLVRPVLACSRVGLEAFLRRRGVSWMVDESNRSLDYTRNRVRHVLLPLLKDEFNPEIVTGLCRLAERSRAVDAFLRQDADENLRAATIEERSGRIVLDRTRVSGLARIRQFYTLSAALRRLDASLPPLQWSHLEKLDAVLGAHGARQVRLPCGVRLSRERGRLVIDKGETALPIHPAIIPITVPGVTDAQDYGGRIETARVSAADFDLEAFRRTKSSLEEALDADAIQGALQLRHARRDDRFHPLAGSPSRLWSFLSGQKVPAGARERQVVLADRDGVVWVVGIRPAHRVRVRPDSRSVLTCAWQGF